MERNLACKEKCLMVESGTMVIIKVTQDGFKSLSVMCSVTKVFSDKGL